MYQNLGNYGIDSQNNKNYSMGNDILLFFWMCWTKCLQFKNHIL